MRAKKADGLEPRKARLQFRVQARPGPGDYFSSHVTLPGEFRIRSPRVDLLAAPAGFTLTVPGDVPLVVYTAKIRGGVQSHVVDTLRVPGGQTVLYAPSF